MNSSESRGGFRDGMVIRCHRRGIFRFLLTMAFCLSLAGPSEGAGLGESTGLAGLRALSTPVELRMTWPRGAAVRQKAMVGQTPRRLLACDLGDANQCFTAPDPINGTYLNVASFFDRREGSVINHFALKLFIPETSGRFRLRGMGFFSQSTIEAFNIFKAAGAIVTDAQRAAFPTRDQLLDLQVQDVSGAAFGTETCVDFGSSSVVLQPGQAAWLVIQFVTAPMNTFIGILADEDATDEECDFFTPDVGETWYRPASTVGPSIDWAITAYTEVLSSKGAEEDLKDLLAIENKSWSIIRRIYRR